MALPWPHSQLKETPLLKATDTLRLHPPFQKPRGLHKYHFGAEYSGEGGRFSGSLKIARVLLSLFREPTPGLHSVAKYSSLAKFNGTKVSRPSSLADGLTFRDTARPRLREAPRRLGGRRLLAAPSCSRVGECAGLSGHRGGGGPGLVPKEGF